jgi:pilus assembly protein CpaB
MNLRSVILGLVAIGIAAAAALFARNMMAGSAAPTVIAAPAAPKAQVLVAAKPLPMGHILTPEDLRWASWPDDGVDDNYVANGEGDPASLAGKVVKVGMQPGQPVVISQIVGPGERGFLAAVLTPGMRAVSVAVSDTSGVGGFIFPGDRVDMILTHEVPHGQGLSLRGAETLLTNVRVLAIDQISNDVEKVAKVVRTVTVEVPPRYAETIAVMQRLGAVSLSLRSLVPGEDPKDPKVALPSDEERSLTTDRQISDLVTMAKTAPSGGGNPLMALLGGGEEAAPKPDMVVGRAGETVDVHFKGKQVAAPRQGIDPTTALLLSSMAQNRNSGGGTE